MEEQPKDHDLIAKIVPIGEAGTGKSTLIRTLLGFPSDFKKRSIGSDFHTVTIEKCKLQIWDTAGSERYRCIAPVYFRHLRVGILCFDLSNADDALRSLERWLEEARTKSNNPNAVCVVVGCKQDLKNTVPQSILDFCNRERLEYFSTSSKTGFGKQELLSRLVYLSRYGNTDSFRRDRALKAADALRDVWLKSNRVLNGLFIPRDVINLLCFEISRDAETDKRWGLPQSETTPPHVSQTPKNTAKSSIPWGIVGLTGLSMAAALLGLLVYE